MATKPIRTSLILLFAMLKLATSAARAVEPDFGANVLVLDPSMRDIQPRIDAIFAKQEANQFGAERCAVLFKPGKYDLDVQVGFYTHVAGLGRSPDDVAITGSVRSKARWLSRSGVPRTVPQRSRSRRWTAALSAAPLEALERYPPNRRYFASQWTTA